MAATESNMLPLGTIAPNFSLPDRVSGKIVSLAELPSQTATVIMFICNHCPFVVHIIKSLVACASEYQKKGVQFIAISSNDVNNYPDDSPEKMTEFAAQHHFSFPYLYDETQQVALAYQAACTPDFYLFDHEMTLVYRGRFDSARPNNQEPVTGYDLRQALNCVLEKKPIDIQQFPSIGCNIKWR